MSEIPEFDGPAWLRPTAIEAIDKYNAEKKRAPNKMLEQTAAALRPYMKKVTKYEKSTTENGWIFTLECGHEVFSPVGPGVFTQTGVCCSECVRSFNALSPSRHE